MWPQPQSLLYVWCTQTSRLFQQWLLLAMRNGVGAAVDLPLHLAELRLGQTVRVGLLAAEYAGMVKSGRLGRGMSDHREALVLEP